MTIQLRAMHAMHYTTPFFYKNLFYKNIQAEIKKKKMRTSFRTCPASNSLSFKNIPASIFLEEVHFGFSGIGPVLIKQICFEM